MSFHVRIARDSALVLNSTLEISLFFFSNNYLIKYFLSPTSFSFLSSLNSFLKQFSSFFNFLLFYQGIFTHNPPNNYIFAFSFLFPFLFLFFSFFFSIILEFFLASLRSQGIGFLHKPVSLILISSLTFPKHSRPPPSLPPPFSL